MMLGKCHELVGYCLLRLDGDEVVLVQEEGHLLRVHLLHLAWRWSLARLDALHHCLYRVRLCLSVGVTRAMRGD